MILSQKNKQDAHRPPTRSHPLQKGCVYVTVQWARRRNYGRSSPHPCSQRQPPNTCSARSPCGWMQLRGNNHKVTTASRPP